MTSAQSFSDVLEQVAEKLPIALTVLRLEDKTDIGSLRLLFTNVAAERVSGGPMKDYVGTTLAESFPHVLETEVADAYRAALETGQIHELPRLTYGDEKIPEAVFALKIVPVSDTHLALLGTNVTEEERAAQRAREAAQDADALRAINSDLETYASLAAHDLQEPLRKMLMFSELVISQFSDDLDEHGVAHLERVMSAANRMQALVSNLLDYLRLGASSIVRTEIDLNQAVRTVVGRLEDQIEDAGAVVETGPLPTIEAERVGIEQLLQNLIGNAIKYRAPDRSPIVRIHRQDLDDPELVRFVVEDNGIGFDPREANRIFMMGERLHGRREFEGSGIGLALARRIVDRHRGTITAEGEPGEGASFVVTVPRSHTGTDDHGGW